jgi:hypothetical protein
VDKATTPSRRNNKAEPGGKGTVRVASQGDKGRRHMGCTGAGAPSPDARSPRVVRRPRDHPFGRVATPRPRPLVETAFLRVLRDSKRNHCSLVD